MRRSSRFAVGTLIAAALATSLLVGAAGAQTDTTSSSNDKNTLKLISAFEKVGESPIAVPQYEDAIQMALKDLKKKGIKVIVHFANEEADLRSMLELRVDGIVTGRPDRLKTLLAEFKK